MDRLVVGAILSSLACAVHGYHRRPCSRHAASDFSLPDCYLPNIDPDLLLSKASFVMSHDAATGYIQFGVSKTGLSSFYSKTQVGTLYSQLNNGARALDLRPFLLQNGTVIFHHGAIHVPVTLESALKDVMQWAIENPSELVLLLTSHSDYENDNEYIDNPDAMTTALSTVYNAFGISYLNCGDVYGLTVGEAMEAATVSRSQALVLALDGQDFYGSFCGKANWIESQVVTCWGNNNRTSCKNSDEQWEKLKYYVLQSANNEPTNDNSQLGPPKNLYVYPFNEVQALWQVDGHAIAMGLAHFSSILEDNHESNVNAKFVDLIYDGEFRAISLFAIDNVALHGNALLSVLRHQCGQSNYKECGHQVPKPPMRRWRIRKSDVFFVLVGAYTIIFAFLFWYKRPKLIRTLWARVRGHGNSKKDCIQNPHQHSNDDDFSVDTVDRRLDLLGTEQRPA